MRERFLRLGALYAMVRDRRWYRALGFSSFESYIADPDRCIISRSYVYLTIDIIDAVSPLLAAGLIDGDDVRDMGIERAREFTKAARAGLPPEQLVTLVKEAPATGPSDYRRNVDEAISGPWSALREAREDFAGQARALLARLARAESDADALGVLTALSVSCMEAVAMHRGALDERTPTHDAPSDPAPDPCAP